jgi:hypothetical protein
MADIVIITMVVDTMEMDMVSADGTTKLLP